MDKKGSIGKKSQKFFEYDNKLYKYNNLRFYFLEKQNTCYKKL